MFDRSSDDVSRESTVFRREVVAERHRERQRKACRSAQRPKTVGLGFHDLETDIGKPGKRAQRPIGDPDQRHAVALQRSTRAATSGA